jgi:hypothetical protein
MWTGTKRLQRGAKGEEERVRERERDKKKNQRWGNANEYQKPSPPAKERHASDVVHPHRRHLVLDPLLDHVRGLGRLDDKQLGSVQQFDMALPQPSLSEPRVLLRRFPTLGRLAETREIPKRWL